MERRRHYRARVEAHAIVHAPSTRPLVASLKGHIVDLSLSGVRIRRTDTFGPLPPLGTWTRLELELGGHGWIGVHGVVHRGDHDELAIEFGAMSPEHQDVIEDEILAAYEALQRPRMLVVDPQAPRRRRVADTLRAAGFEPYEVQTPLEAIDVIERPDSHFAGIAVARSLTQTGCDELCEFVAETNPNIKLTRIAAELEGTLDEPIAPPPPPTLDPTSLLPRRRSTR